MRAETAAIVHTEGESNTSAARSDWSAGIGDAGTRELLARDSAAFLHQMPSALAMAVRQGLDRL